MAAELKLLILEDNPADAELIQRVLQRAGLSYSAVLATNETEFTDALRNNRFDAVLSDNALPQYDSERALSLVKSSNPNLAFILVTGTVSEEFAVKIMKGGADDYILKSNMLRLPTAIINAIAHKRAERAIEEERNLSVAIANSFPGIFYLFNADAGFLKWNRNLQLITGYSTEEIRRMRPHELFVADQDTLPWYTDEVVGLEGSNGRSVRLLTKKFAAIPYILLQATIEYDGQTCQLGVGLDITAARQSELEQRQLNAQLRSLSARLHNAKENEQRRIAREIHDELGQQLTGLKMDIYSLGNAITNEAQPASLQSRLQEASKLVDEAISTLRKIASELHPTILDNLGLPAAMEWQSQEFSKRFQIPVSFLANENAGTLHLHSEVSTGLYRIYQESLTNIARHAGPCKVKTTLVKTETDLVLTIADDGKGFDPALVNRHQTLGLLGMKERAMMIGAKMEVSSAPGKGTEVNITWPLSLAGDPMHE
jgi:two-component system sensor histidine kinase UhpB